MPSATALKFFLADLKQSGFEGEMEFTYAERTVAATDNSIYQQMPLAILYPAVQQDINRAMSCVFRHRDEGFTLCARGGGTGTNGQSLSDNLILDCARHLNRIVRFDRDNLSVEVEPGVVLDQLNAFLQPHGLFFPIDISSSSRATLGGMVATDASGKGSLIYAKTSNYIRSLDLVLSDGSDFRATNINQAQLAENLHPHVSILQPVFQQIDAQREEIERVFPVMDRGLSGYNLKHCIAQPGEFDPCYLLSGSEGTLAITRQITLRLIQRPSHTILSVIFYEHFQPGLEHIQLLLKSRPSAIEMLDDKVLDRARHDAIWFEVQSVLADLPVDREIRAANFVEHVGQSEQEVMQAQQAMQKILQESSTRYAVVMSKIEIDPPKIRALWNLRKRAVGLLGQAQDGKRGVAFVEDSAVPPHKLPAYVNDLRRLLDEHHLEYGMYGHADAGVLHVRPLLNLLQAHDRALIRTLSDQVAQLAKRHGGVLWGEHGRGFRGEYTPLFFGEKLYPVLCNIKKYFDPNNLLNPGKLATPDIRQPLIPLDSITLRGELDEQISASDQQDYAHSLSCNGNGACFNGQLDEAMCPSYKATRNKLYSPKGRAAMIREWLRLKHTETAGAQLAQLEQGLFDSLQHCLSCKSCKSSCPLKVDIPELKSRFLEHWYARRPRPVSAFFARYFESLVGAAGRFPRVSNALMTFSAAEKLFESLSGLGHLPLFSETPYEHAIALESINPEQLKASHQAVILLRDNYLHHFDRETLQASCNILHKLGYTVYLSPVIRNGKLLHVKGYRNEFRIQAAKVCQQLTTLSQSGLPLISVETVTRLLVEEEYAEALGQKSAIIIQSIEVFLARALSNSSNPGKTTSRQPAVTLVPHCMEQTQAKQSSVDWQRVYQKMGIKLKVKNAGCCSMSGIFGHEVNNRAISNQIFNLLWKPVLETQNEVFLASGFSCRCQAGIHDFATQHPAVYLDTLLQPGKISIHKG